MHAAANCRRHDDPFPSACLSCLSLNLYCADKGPHQGVHAQAHPYTPTGKGRRLRGASLSTTHTGTGTGSEGGSVTTIQMVTVNVAVLGLVAAVAGSTAVAVHHLDQTEIKRIQDKAATEIKRIQDKAATEIAQAKADVARDQTEIKRIQDKATAEVARVEGERRLSEERLRAEVERYKYDLRLTQTQDFEPYQAAIRENQTKRGGAGGPQD